MSKTQIELNRGLAQMLKGGVIMDVTTPEQAKIAEAAGACAVMALERIPADIRAAGGVSRMSDPKMIKGIQEAVSIPVMAKCRIGHFAEAQILQAIEIDYIDESEVLSPADDVYHINKRDFKVPFVCGAPLFSSFDPLSTVSVPLFSSSPLIDRDAPFAIVIFLSDGIVNFTFSFNSTFSLITGAVLALPSTMISSPDAAFLSASSKEP